MGECHHSRRYNVFCWEIFGPGVYVDLLLFSVSMFAARFTFEVMMLYCRMKQTEAPQFTAVTGALISQLSETVSTSQVLLDAAA